MVKSIVLAAGKGTRMKSPRPKVLQPLLGTEMINLVLKSLSNCDVDSNIIVVGYKSDDVKSSIKEKYKCDYVLQEEQLGTGHAIMMCKDTLKDFSGHVIVTCGDTPLITDNTYHDLIRYHQDKENDLTVLTTVVENPFGYGRIVRAHNSTLERIVEEKDASNDIKRISEINTGVYIFDSQKLFKNIDELTNDNIQKEYYLTDMIKIFIEKNFKVGAFITSDNDEVMGINDLVALEKANNILKRRINHNHMINGVQIIDSSNTYIGSEVVIGEGSIIYPGNTLLGTTMIGSNVELLSSNYIVDSIVEDDCTIGPMSHIRNKTNIAKGCRIGNFVEIKNSNLDQKTKSAHLTYIGDADVGENVNFGCGVITANYDGVNKFRTIIGDGTFIGSNTNLIAPLTIGSNSFIAAGTTIAKDVNPGTFILQNREYKIKPNKNIK